jgi:HEAT repeat protein
VKFLKATQNQRGIVIGLLLCLAGWLGFHEILRHGCFLLRIQPHYEGKPLEYWCGYQADHSKAVEALHVMKNGSIPFLVKWIGTMNHSSQGTDYESLALHGFEILGPEASPSIPGLIKVIGRNNNWPSSALGHIGSAAVPALIELLTTNQAPDFYGNWRRGISDNTVREHTIEALSYLGTNAQAALPLLLAYYKDEENRSRGDVTSALASVGHNRPDLVVPALTYLLTNSSRWAKFQAPNALASFGSAAKSAIPELLAASQIADDQFKANIGIAIKKIEPENPDALQPLIANLKSEDAGLRESALFQIELFGTNGLEVLGAMKKMAVQEPNPDWRTRILDWLANNETNKAELSSIVQINLTNENESVICAAVRCLGAMADDSQTKFGDLLTAFSTLANFQARENAETCLYLTMRKHPEYLVACLNQPANNISYFAMQFMHRLSRDTLVQMTYSHGTTSNEQFYTMKEIKDADKKLLQDTIPILVEKLHDEKLETRQLATNVLLELSPKAAKQVGVHVEMPYSYYAN